jgi:hypothetical protein
MAHTYRPAPSGATFRGFISPAVLAVPQQGLPIGSGGPRRGPILNLLKYRIFSWNPAVARPLLLGLRH